MSYIEHLLDLAKSPLDPSAFESARVREDKLVVDFLGGKISEQDLAINLSKIDDEQTNYVVLPTPGPLGGIFLNLAKHLGGKINYLEIIDLLDEERLHFQNAREFGLNPRVRLYFLENKVQGELPIDIRVVVTFDTPAGVSHSESIRIIRQVLTNVPNPSRHDLAKLP